MTQVFNYPKNEPRRPFDKDRQRLFWLIFILKIHPQQPKKKKKIFKLFPSSNPRPTKTKQNQTRTEPRTTTTTTYSLLVLYVDKSHIKQICSTSVSSYLINLNKNMKCNINTSHVTLGIQFISIKYTHLLSFTTWHFKNTIRAFRFWPLCYHVPGVAIVHIKNIVCTYLTFSKPQTRVKAMFLCTQCLW